MDYAWILVLTLLWCPLTSFSQTTGHGDGGACMALISDEIDIEDVFSRDDVAPPPLQTISVGHVSECTAQCCQTDRCNVAIHRGEDEEGTTTNPSNETTNCVLYACHPTNTCSFQQEEAVHIFINKQDFTGHDRIQDTTAGPPAASVSTPEVTPSAMKAANNQSQETNGSNKSKTTTSTTHIPPTLPAPPVTTMEPPSTTSQNLPPLTTSSPPPTTTLGPNDTNASSPPHLNNATTETVHNYTTESLFSPTNNSSATTELSEEVESATSPWAPNSTTQFSQIQPTIASISTTTLSEARPSVTSTETIPKSLPSRNTTMDDISNKTMDTPGPPASTEQTEDKEDETQSTTASAAIPTPPTPTTNPSSTENIETTSSSNMTSQPSVPRKSNGTTENHSDENIIFNGTMHLNTTTVTALSNSSSSNSTEESFFFSDRAETVNILLICAVSFGCVFLLATVGVLGKRIYEGYRKRHYSRLDYLINGMYN